MRVKRTRNIPLQICATTEQHRQEESSKFSGKPARGLDPIPRALLRIGIARDVGHNRRAIRPCLQHSRDAIECDPADPNKRCLADFLLPLSDARQALRREGHGFQYRRINGPERDIIRAYVESTRELGFVMRRAAEFSTRAADRGQIRRREIVLAEKDVIAAGVDCLSPIIMTTSFAPWRSQSALDSSISARRVASG